MEGVVDWGEVLLLLRLLKLPRLLELLNLKWLKMQLHVDLPRFQKRLCLLLDMVIREEMLLLVGQGLELY